MTTTISFRNSDTTMESEEVTASELEPGDLFLGGGTANQDSINPRNIRTVTWTHVDGDTVKITYASATGKHFTRLWTTETRVYRVYRLTDEGK